MRGEDTGKHRIRPKLLQLRIGVNLGEVIVGADGDLFGDGINIAVRLEGTADPGAILISEKVWCRTFCMTFLRMPRGIAR